MSREGIDFSYSPCYTVGNSDSTDIRVRKDDNTMIARSNTDSSTSSLRALPSPTNRPTIDEIRNLLIGNVAKSMVVDEEILQEQIAMNGGNLIIKSHIGVAAIAQLEQQLGCRIPGPEDLKPDQFTSIEALVTLVDRKLAEHESPASKR